MVQQAKRSATTVGAILASARQLFIERGFAAVSIDDIAAGAGIAKGGLYHHFRAKHDVFEALPFDHAGDVGDMRGEVYLRIQQMRAFSDPGQCWRKDLMTGFLEEVGHTPPNPSAAPRAMDENKSSWCNLSTGGNRARS